MRKVKIFLVGTLQAGLQCATYIMRNLISSSQPCSARAASAVFEASQTGQRPGSRTKRFFDFMLALALCPLALPLLIVLAILVRATSKGPALHWSDRIGQDNHIFRMPKFRTMRINTPQLATHLLCGASNYLTPIGGFLRRTSLDELPQLYSILAGDLSFVGPRPALFNQDDLIKLRTDRGVHLLAPGLTGWAQVNGRDELPVPAKVHYDCEYLQKQCFSFDLKILGMTAIKVIRREGVSH